MSKWILIADGAQAKVLEYTKLNDDITVVPDAVFNGETAPSRELTSTKRGRVFNSANAGRSAMERPTDPHENEKTKFLKDLSEFLDDRLDQFSELIVFAPPRALGTLRQQLSPQVKSKVQREFDKDLANIPLNDLPKHFQDVLPIEDTHRVVG